MLPSSLSTVHLETVRSSMGEGVHTSREFYYAFGVMWLTSIGGHQHRPLCWRYLTSDIDISYSDIGTKYVGLNPLIPISEESWYRHQLPFRYRTKSISDIPISESDKSFPIDPRQNSATIKIVSLDSNPPSLSLSSGIIPLRYRDLQILLSDIRYRTKVYSDIRYNVGL